MKKRLYLPFILVFLSPGLLFAMEAGDRFLTKSEGEEQEPTRKRMLEENSDITLTQEVKRLRIDKNDPWSEADHACKPLVIKTKQEQKVSLFTELLAVIQKALGFDLSNTKSLTIKTMHEKEIELSPELSSLIRAHDGYVVLDYEFQDVKPIIDLLEGVKDDLKFYQNEPTPENQFHLLKFAKQVGKQRFQEESIATILSKSPCVYQVLRKLGLEDAAKMMRALAHGMPDIIDYMAFDVNDLGVYKLREFVMSDMKKSDWFAQFQSNFFKYLQREVRRVKPFPEKMLSYITLWLKLDKTISNNFILSHNRQFKADLDLFNKHLTITTISNQHQIKIPLNKLCYNARRKHFDNAYMKWEGTALLVKIDQERMYILDSKTDFQLVPYVEPTVWISPVDPMKAICSNSGKVQIKDGDKIQDSVNCVLNQNVGIPSVVWAPNGKYVAINAIDKLYIIMVDTHYVISIQKKSASHHIVGFDPNGNYCFFLEDNADGNRRLTWEMFIVKDNNVSLTAINSKVYFSHQLTEIGFLPHEVLMAIEGDYAICYYYPDFKPEYRQYFANNISFLELMLIQQIQKAACGQKDHHYQLNKKWKPVFDGMPAGIQQYLRQLCQ